LIAGEELRIESQVVTVEAGTDVATGVRWRLEDQKGGRPGRLSGVAGGLEANHSGSVQAFDQGKPFSSVVETLNLDSHDGLLSETVTGTGGSGATEESARG